MANFAQNKNTISRKGAFYRNRVCMDTYDKSTYVDDLVQKGGIVEDFYFDPDIEDNVSFGHASSDNKHGDSLFYRKRKCFESY